MNDVFSKKIREIVKEFPYSRVVIDPLDKFKTDLNDSYNTSTNLIAKEAWALANSGLKSETEFLDELNKIIEQNNPNNESQQFSKVIRSYENCHEAYEDISNEIKQEIKHDYSSKRRFLLFRVLTTIGIAGAALIMAIIANQLGYETAILKKKTDTPIQIHKKEIQNILPKKISNQKLKTRD